jgi:DNA-binding PadR family transcriptional regulator
VSSEVTPAELTLLGLLAEKPRHGYELEEVITARGMREWTEIGFSSIYYLLGRLRDRGLIAEAGPPPQPKGRKVFAPTPDGMRVCAEAAEAAIADPHPVFPALLVGLANQPLIPPDRLRAALDRREAALSERTELVRRTFAAQPDLPEFVQAIFTYTLAQLTAELAWLSDYRHDLAADPQGDA